MASERVRVDGLGGGYDDGKLFRGIRGERRMMRSRDSISYSFLVVVVVP